MMSLEFTILAQHLLYRLYRIVLLSGHVKVVHVVDVGFRAIAQSAFWSNKENPATNEHFKLLKKSEITPFEQ